ncbi:MAG TPA: hypothetical protein VMW89_13345 [Desulfatiglandales bacterium]|nr:hypothetical protein [Desulfatiglandales bacterium]
MNVQIRIGEVSISIEGDAQTADWEIPPAYQPFIQYGKGDIEFHLHRGIPENLTGEKVFESPPVWSLYRKDDNSIIKISDTLSGLERILVFRSQFEKADLYFPEQSGRFDDPFYGPTMELLMVNYLAQGRGAIVHACGIERKGRGILFVGDSGAGKSTMANMWAQEGREGVLSDDRIIVRKKGGRFWMYGTPWHGDASFVSPRCVILERVLLLRHGQENSIKEIKGIDPVSRLITCSFLPHWDPQGMAFSMDFFTDLAAHIPCYEFTFKPDKTAIELVKEIAGY